MTERAARNGQKKISRRERLTFRCQNSLDAVPRFLNNAVDRVMPVFQLIFGSDGVVLARELIWDTAGRDFHP